MSNTRSHPLLDYSAYVWTKDTFWSNLAEVSSVGKIYKKFKRHRVCPYCAQPTIKVFEAGMDNYDELDKYAPFQGAVRIWGCVHCGWWYDEFVTDDGGGDGRVRRRVPFLREFSAESADLPFRTLSRELLARPEVLHELNPKRLEEFTAAVLSDIFDVEATVVGRSGDGGIDVVYINSDKPFAVQVKRRATSTAKEGVSLVREFLGACVLAGYRNCKIVTTAQGFTPGAIKSAGKAIETKSVDSFELIDRQRFLEMFSYSDMAYHYPWTPIALDWRKTWEGTNAKFYSEEAYMK